MVFLVHHLTGRGLPQHLNSLIDPSLKLRDVLWL